MHLLKRPALKKVLWDFLASGGVELVGEERQDLPRMQWFMAKYADQPMDFADASLVVAAERLHIRKVFTLDHHFRVYRPRHTRHFEVFP
jgi:predicted nucleic acid-binding protein